MIMTMQPNPTHLLLSLHFCCLVTTCCFPASALGQDSSAFANLAAAEDDQDSSAANLDDTHVQEVNVGDTAVLTCRSNDDDHRFQFWMINTKALLGPRNEIDPKKYSYRVLSGELRIRNVSAKEHGIYTCICKHLTNNTMNMKSTELIVKRDWEQVYDNDHETNTFRILLLLGMVVLLGVFVFILLTLRNDRSSFLRGLDDEEPLNDEYEKAGASYERMSNSSTQYGEAEHRRASVSTFDNIPLDRGFPKEFQTSAAIEHV